MHETSWRPERSYFNWRCLFATVASHSASWVDGAILFCWVSFVHRLLTHTLVILSIHSRNGTIKMATATAEAGVHIHRAAAAYSASSALHSSRFFSVCSTACCASAPEVRTSRWRAKFMCRLATVCAHLLSYVTSVPLDAVLRGASLVYTARSRILIVLLFNVFF